MNIAIVCLAALAVALFGLSDFAGWLIWPAAYFGALAIAICIFSSIMRAGAEE